MERGQAIWVITGFQVVLFLGTWFALVVLHASWRSFRGPEEDPVRESGPLS